jgi:hypothetical protein
MANRNPNSEEPKERENSWNERRDWHPMDKKLRDAGFEITDRPKKGPDLWRRKGAKSKLTVEAALEMAQNKQGDGR